MTTVSTSGSMLLAAGFGLFLLSTVTGTAQAQVIIQTPTQTTPMMSVPATDAAATVNCLCLDKAIRQRRDELSAVTAIYQRAQDALAARQRAIEALRNASDPNDEAAVDRQREAVANQQQAEAEFRRTTLPDYAAAVDAYNQPVTAFTAQCVARGFSFEAPATRAIAANLSCPN